MWVGSGASLEDVAPQVHHPDRAVASVCSRRGEVFNPAAVTATRYRYRGNRIPNPFPKPSFIDLPQRTVTRFTDPARQALVATGLIGALTARFTAYLDGRLATTREEFLDYGVNMLLSRVSSY
jgi:hypothetical protein